MAALGWAAPPITRGARTRMVPPHMCTSAKGKLYGRCEPWAPEKATLLEVINVIGRFRDSAVWAERKEFAVVADAKETTADQAATADRADFAKRLNQVERVAFIQNVPSLPFTDEALAAAVGRRVDEFESMPVLPDHMAVVFDSIAQSKSSVVSREDADERIARWRTADGRFDDAAFGAGLQKGFGTVIRAYAVLYFLLGCGVAVVGKFLLDAAGASSSL